MPLKKTLTQHDYEIPSKLSVEILQLIQDKDAMPYSLLALIRVMTIIIVELPKVEQDELIKELPIIIRRHVTIFNAVKDAAFDG